MRAGLGHTTLLRELHNAHDKDAICVMIGQHHVGYVPKALTASIKCGPAHVVSIGDEPAHVWLAVEGA
jgi:hypothetical protein